MTAAREAVIARCVLETLESRTLLAATFANLPYADPFPAPTQLGQASQNAGNVLYTESFSDQSPSNGVLGASDHYWNDQATVTRTLPGSMQNGLAQMSVEFWLNVPAGTGMGNGTAIKMPGIEVSGTSNWARTPSGALSMKFSTTKAGEPLETLSSFLGVINDGQWHQYVATFDGQTAFFYADGQLAGQTWLTNSADKAGPQVFSGSTVSTPSAITYTPFSGNPNIGLDEVRVSNIALTPRQVKRNFENDHIYSSTWYVSPTGLSTNSGTRSSPLDLVTGLTHVAADNKIVLLPGTYSGAQFQVTGSGAGALHNSLITGDDGSSQAIIQTTGSGTGPTVSSGAKYVTLRNLTFSSDLQAGLTVSASGIGNIIDGCRLTSNVDALSVLNSSGYQDPMSWDAAHYIIVPAATLENSVLAAGTSSAGVRYNNSKVIIARNNTFTGGQYGAYFTGGSTDVTLLNNIFNGQTGSGVYFNSDSLMDVDSTYSLVSYFGDGNIYNPSGAGYVATVVDGATNNYSTVSDYAKYWYTKQYGTAILNYLGDVGAGIAARSEQRSFLGSPSFASSGSGDFRLAATAPNLIDIGADRVYGRTRIGVTPTVWDAQGNVRAQGNAVDAGAYETAGAVSQTFTLTTAASTSAGVFDSNGKLIRTLWSGVKYPAGSVSAYWNGLDDNNNPMSNGSYTIKLLSNNVQYSWDGAMNNSNPLDGPNVQANFLPIQSMLIVGTNAYYAPGYNEGRYQLYKFALSNINQVTGYGVGPVDINSDIISYIASDGTTLYTMWQTHAANATIIKSYDLNFNATGLSANVGTAAGGGAGIAVQPAQQNLLFVSHSTDNKIYIYNKGNFTPYSTAYLDGAALGWNTPKSIATTSDGDLWVTCKNTGSGQWQVLRYTNFGGTPSLAATVTGLVNPIGLAVSLDGNKTLMVADGETATTVSQQIKAYTPAGASLWTLGQAGGYASNGPTITNDKFILQGMICPQSDGSFWITDLATENRTMHFSAARAFVNDIQYARSYNAAGDQNNATRVFQNFVEYQIDYSKAYTQNQGWTPVKNWNYLGTKNLLPGSNYGGSDGLSVVATLSNSRTYALVNTQALTGNSGDAGKMSVVELTATGLRDSGYKTPAYSGYWLDKDGSLINTAYINGNTTVQFNRLAMTGFDASGNPQYAASATVLATAPVANTWDSQSPADSYGLPYYGPEFLQLDSGLLVNYNPQVHGAGMHLGVVNPSTNQWLWQTMPTGPFSGRGNYDTNGWYSGNRPMANGHNIITGYNGEGWLGAGQANQFTHYYDDGLFVGQFGTSGLNGGTTWPNAYGFSGNSFAPFLATSGGSLYLYANDESDRSLQRWQATGLNTIQEISLGVALGLPAAPSGLSATTASQTQINLSWTDNSNNETGFKVERAADSNFTTSLTLLTTTAANVTSYSSTGLTANTLYYYRVRATNAGGDSANSGTASATTLPNAPTAPSGLAATAASTTQIDLTWTDNSSNETGFKVERATNSTFTTSLTLLTTTAANATSYSSTGLTASTLYYYRVRATNTGGDSSNSNTASATTIVAPSALSATATSQTQINLTWTDNSSNETGFKVERAANSTFTTSLTLLTTTAAGVTSYSSTGLTANTLYYYRVRATCAGGDSINSNTTSATTLPNAPTAPSGLSATVASQTQINLSWTDNSNNETGFKVERAANSTFTTSLTLLTTTAANVTSYSSTGLTANTTYYYRVRATNTGGDSANSNTASGTTQAAGSGMTYDATVSTSFSFGSGPSYASNSSSVFGGGWYDVSGTATLKQTASPPSGYSLSFPAAGGPVINGTARIGVVDLSTVGVADSAANSRAQCTSSGTVSASLTVNIASGQSGKVHVIWGSYTDNSTGGAKLAVTDQSTSTTIDSSTQSDLAFTMTYNQGYISRHSTFNLASGSRTLSIVGSDNGTAGRAYLEAIWVETSAAVPAAPSGLSVTATSQTQINLSWTDNSSNETGFKVDIATNSAFAPALTTVTVGANVTTYSSTGLSAGTTYYYRVRATNTGGDSANTTTASATTQAGYVTGSIGEEIWTGISGTTIPAIPTGTTPNQTATLTTFEIPVNSQDNYGVRIRGYFIPQTTGTYYFWISSDDQGELWLSTDAQVANKARIAYVNSWTNSREWNKEANQASAAKSLTAGVAYYIEALMKEGAGGDNLAIAYKLNDSTTPINGAATNIIPGSLLAPFPPAAPSGLTATKQSSGQINLAWIDNAVNESGFKIERATDASFTQNLALLTITSANVLTYSDTGLTPGVTYYYRVRATNGGGDSANSNVASATA